MVGLQNTNNRSPEGGRERSIGSRDEPTNTSQNSVNSSDTFKEMFEFFHNELRISRDVAKSYCISLTENGYEDVASLQDATENDLKELGVKLGHLRRIKRTVFSNYMRKEKFQTDRTRRSSEIYLDSKDKVNQINVLTSSIEGSLQSDYARQEVLHCTTYSQETVFENDVADAKELLIRRQAEKIACLEAKLAFVGSHSNIDDVKSPTSRGSSADTYSKKLTAEERLKLHRERKLQENKYKEKTGKWEPPPPVKNETSLLKKVSANEDLVLKLTADPTFRKEIDKEHHSLEKSSRKVRKKSLQQKLESDSQNLHSLGMEKVHHDLDTSLSHGDYSLDIHKIQNKVQYGMGTVEVNCSTCGSTRNCEEDIDNPGIHYCKECWDEYERALTGQKYHSKLHDDVTGKDMSNVSSSNEVPHAIWIVHDNPKLGEKIICSGSKRMECMIETKDPKKKDCVRIIVGDIDFSGNVEDSGIGNTQGVANEQGTECIRIINAKGYFVDHNQVASRLSRDKAIFEFQLEDKDAHVLTGNSSLISVRDFFDECYGAIDVILDPQKDAGGWYPYKEARKEGGKIAPQFRSKGVGYIRLGDDMSRNGLAFLSINACSSFLLQIGNKNIASSKSSSPPLSMKPSSNNSSVKNHGQKLSLKENKRSMQQVEPSMGSHFDDTDDKSEDEIRSVVDVLKQLQSADMSSNTKWKDKAELISHLGKGASREDSTPVKSQALNVIEDTLSGKNGNIHVIRSSLIAAGMIGVSMGGELVSQISWKPIMIEMMKLLKSKQCCSVAKAVLLQLHGRCFALANSLEVIGHVLGVGKASLVSNNKNSKISTAIDPPQQRKKSTGTGSNIEIIEWLAEITERERSMDVVNPTLENNGFNVLIDLFMSHADHRDQRCRQNVLDGLMHCILYGVKNLRCETAQMMNKCSRLEETNPKGWNNIRQCVNSILEEERLVK